MSVSFTQTANPAGVNSSGNVATYTNVAIGDAHPDRIVVVCVGTELASASINSCTLGGSAMNAGTQGNQGDEYARTFYRAYPTGTTATIEVTFGANASSTQNHIAVYNVSDGAYSATGADQSTDMDATDPLTTGSTTIASDGGMIAVAAGAADGTAKTWANITEDIDADAGAFRFTTATSTTAGTATRTCTGGTNGEDGALSYLIFTNLTPSSSISPSSSVSPSPAANELDYGLVSYYDMQGDSVDHVGGNNGTDTDITYGTDWISVTPTISLSKEYVEKSGDTMTGALIANDHGTATTAEMVGVCYGTGEPPTANTTPIGTLFVKYIN